MQPDALAAARFASLSFPVIDDRHPFFFVQETPTQLDAGFPIQVDVEDEAKGLAEVLVAKQRIGRLDIVHDKNGPADSQDALPTSSLVIPS